MQSAVPVYLPTSREVTQRIKVTVFHAGMMMSRAMVLAVIRALRVLPSKLRFHASLEEQQEVKRARGPDASGFSGIATYMKSISACTNEVFQVTVLTIVAMKSKNL